MKKYLVLLLALAFVPSCFVCRGKVANEEVVKQEVVKQEAVKETVKQEAVKETAKQEAVKEKAVEEVVEEIDLINAADNSRIEKIDMHLRFLFNSTELTDESKSKIALWADEIKEYPNAAVVITGHTDSTGEEQYNQRLSLARAAYIADALQNSYGVKNQIEIAGKGYAEPKASNDTEEGQAINRRVEIDIDKPVE